MFSLRPFLIILSFALVVSFGLKYFLFHSFAIVRNHLSNDPTDGRVHLQFVQHVYDDWLKDVQNYLVEEINWDNRTFTAKLAQCIATCDQRSVTHGRVLADTLCTSHPLLISDAEVVQQVNLKIPYAEATLPCFLHLAASRIPEANRGIFSNVALAKGVLFGPYTGIIRSAVGDDGESARNSGYSWRIGHNDENGQEADFYVDGADENHSNWMRYVNSARFEEEQNLYPLEFNKSIFYVTYKDVEADTELLVWYGQVYANWMGIDIMKNATGIHNWEMDFAPKKNIVVCPSCENKLIEIVFDDEQEDVVNNDEVINIKNANLKDL